MAMVSKKIAFAVLTVIISGCTAPKPDPVVIKPAYEKLGAYKERPNSDGQFNNIDIGQLKHELMVGGGGLGHSEVAFNSCGTSANRSQRPRCVPLFLSHLKLELFCRRTNAQGNYISSLPLPKKVLVWTAGGQRGTFRTDAEGSADLYWISRRRNSNHMMRMNLGPHILKKRLKDQWKVILPKSWCHS